MKKFFQISLLILLTSCSHYLVNNEGFIRPPKNYKFSYQKKSAKLTEDKIIDTTAIYYLTNSNYYRNSNEYKNNDGYIRFYSNGQFKIQGTKTYPKIEDINNVNYGVVGYFKIKGNVIKLQIYTDINAGSDQLEFGIIDENSDLILLNENPRTDFCLGYSEKSIRKKINEISIFRANLNPKIYKKIKIEEMTYNKPNW
ncbi:hypothetical protein SAMN05444372_1291 [Flavobacterium micromati]|uniref:Lipoprotein n=1 Tax=Flavobacterium micromati TaxID=229205 RepID=A0A1M5R6D1_9FLAO|nr:hypothetical protein [Flavobacterium micromati]SHH21945.1 hypothetical protein SAMN05444372_1291 [Flavobacterium micromati]